MEHKILGKTGLEVSIMGLGGIPIQSVSFGEAQRVVERALDLGVTFIDTARSYTNSEEKIGQVMKRRRGECILASKVFRRSKKEAEEDINTSLRNLKTDMIDLYQLHDVSRERDYERIFGPNGALEAVKKAREQGKIRFIGVSGHRQELLLRLIKTGEFDTVQLPVNAADLDIAKAVTPVAREMNLGIIGMKAFAGGNFKDVKVALRFALDQDVSVVIPGMKKVSEVEENIGIANSFKPLTDEEREVLLEEAKQLGANFCRQCGYCQPCPEGVDIPKILLLERYYSRYWLKDVATEQYRKLDVKADSCVECGECEEKCPYQLPVRELLKEAHMHLRV